MKIFFRNYRSLIFITCMLCSRFAFINAQNYWPPINNHMKPWTRWWWQGSGVNEIDIKANMSLYRKAGLGGLEITPIYGVKGYESQFIDYLSPKWMDMLSVVLQEAKSLGLGIDMATGTGWPFGGPWISDQYASKYFTYKRYVLEGGHRLKDSIQFRQEGFVRTANGIRMDVGDIKKNIALLTNPQVLAIDQVRFDELLPLYLLIAYDTTGRTIELTDKVIDHVLDWTAPPGMWTLYAVFYGLHGKMVERAAPGGEGPVIDHFDPQALKQYLSKFDSAFKQKDLSGLRGFFNDSYEVDDARGQSNYTPLLFNEFKKRRGYDLWNELPALFSTSHTEHSSRVIYDYRETISELLLEKFTMPWTQWGHAKNKLIRNQSHGSPANILDLYAAVDIPETEGNEISRFKFASSAAHVMNKSLVSAEAATWLDEHFKSSLADVRNCVDLFFLGGINHIFYHGTNYSPIKESWPGWLFYAATHLTPSNPIWKDFKILNAYVARCQSFLQEGQSDNELLVYFPFSDRIHQPGTELLHHFDGMKGFESSVFQATADSLMAWGYGYDFISDRQIQDLSFQNGLIQSHGHSYQAILISGAEYMPLHSLFKLDSLMKKGAKILFHSIPTKVPGYYLYQKRQNQLDSLSSALHLLPTGIANPDLRLKTLLNHSGINPESELYGAGLQCVKRNSSRGHTYFIKNSRQYKFEGWIPVHVRAAYVMAFDPMYYRSGLIPVRTTKSGIEIYLSIEPGESIILLACNNPIKTHSYEYYQRGVGSSISLNQNWTLKFLNGGPVMTETILIDSLRNWLDLPIPGISSFSGTAMYSTTFKKPKTNYSLYTLDLGKVLESAEIKLNGKTLTTCIGPRYSVIIPTKMFMPANKLDIIVTNSMVNRIIDLDKRKVSWKKFYNINFPARFAENKGEDGLFSATLWKPKESGLIGPVTLTPLKLKE